MESTTSHRLERTGIQWSMAHGRCVNASECFRVYEFKKRGPFITLKLVHCDCSTNRWVTVLISWFNHHCSCGFTMIQITVIVHLVGGLEHFLFSIIYGMSSFPLTNSYFSRWFLHHQPVIGLKMFKTNDHGQLKYQVTPGRPSFPGALAIAVTTLWSALVRPPYIAPYSGKPWCFFSTRIRS